jgi:hypothetical protein
MHFFELFWLSAITNSNFGIFVLSLASEKEKSSQKILLYEKSKNEMSIFQAYIKSLIQ